jgi:ISXO2-like transposase domain/Protein of unknown function (DUF2380)
VTLWALLFVSCGPTVAQSVAVFDFELIDTSLEGAIRGARLDEQERLAHVSDQLRQLLRDSGRFSLVDITPIAREAQATNLQACGEAVRAESHKVSLLCTDQWTGYRKLDKEYPHAVIDHAKGQYVIGAVQTQTIEGFWSIFKRGVMGTFHKMSAKYMPLYVAEFQFRYNNRENADIFGTAISGC